MEFGLKAFHELVKADLVMVIGEFGELLHRTIGLVTFKHDRVEYLRHNEEVVNFLPQDVL